MARLAAAEPELIQDLVDVQVGPFNSSWNSMHAVQNAQTVRQATEALLDVKITLLEAPGAYFARILLLATGHKHNSYAKLKTSSTESPDSARAITSSSISPQRMLGSSG